MFNEEIYKKFAKSRFYKLFRLYCVIGAAAFAVIGLILLASAKYIGSGVYGILCIAAGALCICVPVIFIINAVGKPFLCAEGEITEIKKKSAVVKVDGKEINASSFEHFLNNSSLKDYAAGDKVIIYSHDKKLTRPLFYKIRNLEFGIRN